MRPTQVGRNIKRLETVQGRTGHCTVVPGTQVVGRSVQARGLWRLLGLLTRDLILPPWMPPEGCRDLRDNRGLTDAEIATFAAWDAAGAPEGDRSTFAPASWRLYTSDAAHEQRGVTRACRPPA